MSYFKQVYFADFIGYLLFIPCFIIYIACKKYFAVTNFYKRTDTVYIFAELDFMWLIFSVKKLGLATTDDLRETLLNAMGAEK